MYALHNLIRTVLIFSLLLVFARLLGKKQVSQLTFFNYITGITVGGVAAEATLDTSIPLLGGVVCVSAWCLLAYAAGWIGLKNAKARILLDGEPTIVIKKGGIVKQALARLHLNMDDLSMLLRQHGVFQAGDVEYAIIEPDGQLSVMLKSGKNTLTREDVGLSGNARRIMPTELIADGKVLERNLRELGLSDAWLNRRLRERNIGGAGEVFYAELQEDGTLYIDKESET